MFRTAALTVTIGLHLAASLPALACMESAASVRDRENRLLEAGLRNPRIPAAELAKARQLRAQSEALFGDADYERALAVRHAALTVLGFTRTDADAGAPVMRGAVRGGAKALAFHPCGAAGTWSGPVR